MSLLTGMRPPLVIPYALCVCGLKIKTTARACAECIEADVAGAKAMKRRDY
jgi:hypothetical protein